MSSSDGTSFFRWDFALSAQKAAVTLFAYADRARAPQLSEGFRTLEPVALAQYRAICGCPGPER